MKLTPNIKQSSSNPTILTPRSYQSFIPNQPIPQSPPSYKPLQSKTSTTQDIISQKSTNRTIKYDDNLTYLQANDRISQFQNRFLSDYKKHGTYTFSDHAKYVQDLDTQNIHNNENIVSIDNIGQQEKKLSSAHKQTYKQLKILILQQLTQLLNQHKIETAQHLREAIIKIDSNMKKYCTVQFNHQFLSYSYMDEAEKHFQMLENRLNTMEKQLQMETNRCKWVHNEKQKQKEKEKENKQDRDKSGLEQIVKIRQQIAFIQSQVQNHCYLNNQLRQQMIQNSRKLQKQIRQIRQIRDNTYQVLQYQIFNQSSKDNQKYKRLQDQNDYISQDINKIRQNIQEFNGQQAIMRKTINQLQQKMQKIGLSITRIKQKQIKSQKKEEQILKNSLTPISIPIPELTNNQSLSQKPSQPPIQPIKSISLTYSISSISDFLSPKNQTNKISSIKSLKQINAKSMKYIIDNDNNLMDDMGNYIWDDQGNQIKLTEEQIAILKQSKFVKYKQQQ